MASSKSPSVVTIRLTSSTRWILLIPALLVILSSWFVVRWYVGDLVAEYAPAVEEGGLEMARLAVRWAPSDPLTHWRLGAYEEKVFSAETLAAAVREYQAAVALSPHDYRYWMELGRALEAAGDSENGEKALRRAVDLAPAYSHPRWHLGNLLLRAGKLENAFRELGVAAVADDQMRPQVFELGMRVLDGNIDEISRLACTTAATRMHFAIYLVGKQRFDDAMRMWASISSADRQSQGDLVKGLMQSLLDAKQFRRAIEVMPAIDSNAKITPDEIRNGGFESPLASESQNAFDWIITSRPHAQIGIDARAHSGSGSLRLVFKAPKNLDKIPITQTVVVEAGAQYSLEWFFRTEDLKGASTPILVIRDAVDGSNLVEAKPLPTETNEWQQVTLAFKTKPGHDGITIAFYRAPCTGTDICPIFGTVWYDDFKLQRLSGPDRTESGTAKR
jgi:hypothetical protein